MKRIKTSLIVSSLLISTSLLAQNAPSSSDILRQVEPPKLPKEVKPLPQIKTQTYKSQLQKEQGATFLVHDFTFSGNTVFNNETLNKLIASYKNRSVSIHTLEEIASIITKYYRDNGYFVARAYIPNQELDEKNSVVEIAIIEGLYGKFEMKNRSHVKQEIVQNYMNKLQGGDKVSTFSLERQMLLINDLAGASVTNAEIWPGSEVGKSDFTITVEKEAKYYGYAIADNYGSRYTGQHRLNLAGFVNSLNGKGDVLGVSVLSSHNSDLKNARVSYESPIGYEGLKANIALATTTYKIGKEFKAQDIKGDSINFTTGLSYPIIKTRVHTLNSSIQYNHKRIEDKNINEDKKKEINSITVSLNDSINTTWFEKNGILQSSLALTQGKVGLKSADAIANDTTLQSQGSFTKLNISLSQTQFLTQQLSLLSSFSTQKALRRNLDGSEDFSAGGAYGVRAYTDSELSGDQGYLASLELLVNLPTLYGENHFVSAFLDHSKVWYDKENQNNDPNNRMLNAIGLGYTLNYSQLSFKTTFAHGFGGDKTPTSNGDDTNLNQWLVQAIYQF